MDVDALARTIQLIIAPVVMVTACAILLGSLWSHYAAVNDRLHALARERLDLWRAELAQPATSVDAYTSERLDEIDRQAPALLLRHRRIRDALVAIYAAILVFIISMFAIAVTALAHTSWAAALALVLFLAGTAWLLWGVVLTVLEVRVSQMTLEYEVRRVLALGRREKTAAGASAAGREP